MFLPPIFSNNTLHLCLALSFYRSVCARLKRLKITITKQPPQYESDRENQQNKYRGALIWLNKGQIYKAALNINT